MIYQELLALANRQMRIGQIVPVRLHKKPGNPVDLNALAFIVKPIKIGKELDMWYQKHCLM